MAIRTIVALALALGTIGSALAATKQQLTPPRQSAYEQRNSFIPTDPDQNVRWELRRDPSNDR